MTTQLIELVNTTNNIVFENLKKLNSKFKAIQNNQILNEEEEYDSLNCKINIYFTTIIEQMKSKFIVATQEYEKQIEQNNKDILNLIMENMLLKIENDSLLEEKKKNDIYLSDYIDLTIKKEKNFIKNNINKNLNNIKKTNSKKKYNNKNCNLNNGIYSFIKSEFNQDINKNNIGPNNNISNNIYNYNLLEILNKNGSKKKKRNNSYNKFNNNNYNFNFIAGLDLNHYNTHNKANISYNTVGKTLYDSQENFKIHKNKNSFSLNDFRKIKNAFSQKRTKKNSYKNKKNNIGIFCNYLNENNYINVNYKNKNNEVQNISFRDNKVQFTEPSLNGNNKKKEKINFYCIKKIKDEMKEILKNKKSTSNNNSNNNININTSGNFIDISSSNKIKLPLGYNYYPKNKNNIIKSSNNNLIKKNNLQNKTPKNVRTHKQANISDILVSDFYKDSQYKTNYTIANNQKISPNNKKLKISSVYNSTTDNNHSINNYTKKDLINNFSGLKNLKKSNISNNHLNSKSYLKLNISKNMNINNYSNKTSKKEKTCLGNNYYYNDNIYNNISYNLGNKNGISRNYSNSGNSYNSYAQNNIYKTINNYSKLSSYNINNRDENNNNVDININNNNAPKNSNIIVDNNNLFNFKIKNRVKLSKNRMNINLGKNINNNKKTFINNNISGNILLNNKEIDYKKTDIKKIVCINDENNKNETPSFYIFKK